MGKNIRIDQLASEVMETLDDYKDLAADDLKKAVKDAGKTVKDEIGANAPRKTGKYAKSWRTKVTAETSESISLTVYSPGRYQIAHLLENGHAKRNGGRVRAIPHIAPAEQHGEEQLERDLRRKLGGGV